MAQYICHVAWAYRALEGQIRFFYGVFYAEDDSTIYEHATASLQMQMDSQESNDNKSRFQECSTLWNKTELPLGKI
jgi:hypothetical protein